MRNGIIIGAGAAFFGAFFGYCFSRFTDWIKNHVERRRQNKNALVRLERLYSSQLNVIAENVFIADSLIQSISASSAKSPIIAHRTFHAIPVDNSSLLDLLNIDYINAAYSSQVGLERLNRDTTTLNQSYAELRAGLISRTISPENYQNNLPHYKATVEQVKLALGIREQEVRALAACTRVLLRKKYLLGALSLSLVERIDQDTINKTHAEFPLLLNEIKNHAPVQVLDRLKPPIS